MHYSQQHYAFFVLCSFNIDGSFFVLVNCSTRQHFCCEFVFLVDKNLVL